MSTAGPRLDPPGEFPDLERTDRIERKSGPLRSSNLSDYFRPIRGRLGPPSMRLYDLCHARAGLMLKAGTDPFTASWEMRHADIRTTFITYLEPDEELGRNEVTALDQMVGFQPSLARAAGPRAGSSRRPLASKSCE